MYYTADSRDLPPMKRTEGERVYCYKDNSKPLTIIKHNNGSFYRVKDIKGITYQFYTKEQARRFVEDNRSSC